MIKNMSDNYDEIENIKIINNTTREVTAIITFLDGMINIKTKKPYSIYTNKKSRKGAK